MDNKKRRLSADAENVQEIVTSVDKHLIDIDHNIIDVMTALVVILIARTKELKLPKPTLLGYISNTWELNDPETDLDDLRSRSPEIKY